MGDVEDFELERMVDFFYGLDYSDKLMDDEKPLSLLRLHAYMFAIGDKYDIPMLKVIAVEKYLSRCSLCWDAVEFLESIYDVYRRAGETAVELRQAAVKIGQQKLLGIADKDKIWAAYKQVMELVPEFTQHLLVKGL